MPNWAGFQNQEKILIYNKLRIVRLGILPAIPRKPVVLTQQVVDFNQSVQQPLLLWGSKIVDIVPNMSRI
jgi:hypothetical protein